MRIVIALALLAAPARADDQFTPRNTSVTWTSTGLIDELRMGLELERGFAGELAPTAARWHGWRLTGIAGAGFSVVTPEPMTSDSGGALWLAGRLEYGGGGVVDGTSGEFALALAAGPVIDIADATQVAIVYRPGIVMRYGRFRFTFAMALEHVMWSDRGQRFAPGVDVGLGLAF